MKTKRILGAALSALLTAFFCLSPAAGAAGLNDIKNYNFEQEILLLNVLGIVEGDENGDFNPNEYVTRAEAAKLMMTAFSYDGTIYSPRGTEFSDVGAEHWASGYIQAAADVGHIAGMGDGTYMPESNITFEQACTLIVRALGYDMFAQDMGGYPTGHMYYANDLGLTEKLSFSGTDDITRGEFAYILAKAMEAPMVEALGGFFGSSQLIIMQGTGTGYVCPMGEYHSAFRVDGTVTGTPRNNDDVRNGEMKINITYARRLGNAYISSAVPIEIKCKTADSDGEINKLLFMRGEFVLKLTDTEEYTALMIII
ncbi:MAG TPA: S-layer homology domain-containing protein [Candidatus Ornithomonoglobus intestinigallinarum]|uniref:S-layer homology domain-containing protein n=1 Tax=Candidatus Ornithomonoglobus intestinigallinarum TaxID=2840894 RepID=A0A9D1H2V4_9FIRM|nr:S-layer homology domain-containing protein [Candidatus Ornithomonoglobus intestinigallinarum]